MITNENINVPGILNIFKEVLFEDIKYHNYLFNTAFSKVGRTISNYKIDFLHVPIAHTTYGSSQFLVKFQNCSIESLRSDYFASRRYDDHLKHTSLLFNKYRNINLNPKLNIKGAYINIQSIKSLEILNRQDEAGAIKEFYYIGKRHILFGYINNQLNLIIRSKVLDIILKSNEREICKTLIRDILDRHVDILSHINTLDMNFLNPITAQKIKKDTLEYIRRMYPISIPNYDINPQIIDDISSSVVSKISKNTVFGCSKQFNYSDIISEIFSNHKRILQTDTAEAFKTGLIVGIKLEALGWKYSQNQKFISASFSKILYEKEVNIIPKIIIYRKVQYEIPEEYRYWKITKLYYDIFGLLFADGTSSVEVKSENHPNIDNNGKVCTGDLNLNCVTSEPVLKSSLLKVESLLERINLDSPHRKYEFIIDLIKNNKFKCLEVDNKDIEINDIDSIVRGVSLNNNVEEIDLSEINDQKEKIELIEDEDKKIISAIVPIDTCELTTNEQLEENLIQQYGEIIERDDTTQPNHFLILDDGKSMEAIDVKQESFISTDAFMTELKNTDQEILLGSKQNERNI